MNIALVPEKQLPQGDWPMPIAPQLWHYRQSIDYEITNNRAILDIASRYRETWLYNIYQMGRNSIRKGSRDTWTITPKRIAALEAAAQGRRAVAGRGAGEDAGERAVPSELYNTVLHDPKCAIRADTLFPPTSPIFPPPCSSPTRSSRTASPS